MYLLVAPIGAAAFHNLSRSGPHLWHKEFLILAKYRL